MATAAISRSTRTSPAASTGFQFGLARTAFHEALTRVATALPSRTTLPVLNTVLIETRKGEIALRCSDLDRTVDTTVAAVVTGEGSALLPAKRLLEIIGALASTAVVQIHVDGRKAKITAGRSKFELVGMSVEEYPKIAVDAIKGWATFAAAEFCDAIQRVSTHAANEMSRPQMSSVLLDIEKDATHVVGLDGFHLARVALGADANVGPSPLVGQFLLPRAVVTAAAKLFADAERVTITGTRQQLRFSSGPTSMIARLTEGEYPNYLQLLVVAPSAYAIVSREDLTGALKRVKSVSDGDRVEFTFRQKELVLGASSEDQGNGEDVIDCAFTAGEWTSPRDRSTGVLEAPCSVALNPNHVNVACEAIRGEQVRFDFTTPRGVIYIRDAATPKASTLAVTLPLRPPGAGEAAPPDTTRTKGDTK
jgi:DNA polymerase-3 subunit beta